MKAEYIIKVSKNPVPWKVRAQKAMAGGFMRFRPSSVTESMSAAAKGAASRLG
jgi:hypothetical protein